MDEAKARSVLGVPEGTYPAAIHARYRLLAMERHPDRPGGDPEAMRELNEARRVLLNPKAPADGARDRELRSLAEVRKRIENVDATVKLWDPKDYRIPKMRGPLEKLEKEILGRLSTM